MREIKRTQQQLPVRGRGATRRRRDSEIVRFETALQESGTDSLSLGLDCRLGIRTGRIRNLLDRRLTRRASRVF